MPKELFRERSVRFAVCALVFSAAAIGASLAPLTALAADGGSREGNPRAELVLRALSLLGVNYKLGGNSPDTGLDCSGLVRHVFGEAMGLILPRRAEEISRAGDEIDSAQLKPGDLVFFNTLRRAFSHVGIYIGNNQFVHAPSSGGSVRVESLSGQYWTRRFNGARRVLALDSTAQETAPARRPAPFAGPASGVPSSGPSAATVPSASAGPALPSPGIVDRFAIPAGAEPGLLQSPYLN